MSDLAVTLDSKLDVSHLSIQPDGDEYTVGDVAADEFIRIPYEGVAAIRLLDGTRTLGEAQAHLLASEEIEVDFLDFAETLLELKLVRSLDGQMLIEEAPQAAEAKLGWTQPLGNFLFGKGALALYVLFAVASVVMIAALPSVQPHYQDLFVFSSIGVSMLVLFVWTWGLLLLHEVGHMLAAAGAGAPVRFKLSVRWMWVVVEAEMNGLWAKSRNARYVPFLAGMCWDTTVLFLSLLVQLWLPESGLLHRLAEMTALMMIYQLFSQLMIFLRTDLYFVLITATHAANLSGDAKLFLKRTFLPSTATREAWQALSHVERRHATWFGLLYGVAGAVVAGLAGLVMIPAILDAVSRAWTEVASHSGSSLLFWDGMLVLLVTAANLALYAAGTWSRYRGGRVQQKEAVES
ncbi:hypothetical protein OS242_04720 [Tumebacillus sp. DT12]|uniref:Peptidase M50 domain-containing protein n=1 Tax=Tumebacillus lacus TaxID=2995335 RepID=A0ABT3WX50_9BACL|nr:hypothetical protein [Tumebacillus lacus]MCX7569255.1 hypothetical protein [Tumebacillus lacus]